MSLYEQEGQLCHVYVKDWGEGEETPEAEEKAAAWMIEHLAKPFCAGKLERSDVKSHRLSLLKEHGIKGYPRTQKDGSLSGGGQVKRPSAAPQKKPKRKKTECPTDEQAAKRFRISRKADTDNDKVMKSMQPKQVVMKSMKPKQVVRKRMKVKKSERTTTEPMKVNKSERTTTEKLEKGRPSEEKRADASTSRVAAEGASGAADVRKTTVIAKATPSPQKATPPRRSRSPPPMGMDEVQQGLLSSDSE